MFKIVTNRTTQKVFKSLPKKIQRQINTVLLDLRVSDNPEMMGIQLAGVSAKTFRIRSGNYRILYEVDFKERLLRVLKIGHRKDVYRSLG